MSDILLLLAGFAAGSLATVAILLPRLRAAQATGQLLEARAASVLKERQALEADLAAARDALQAGHANAAAENGELRRRMDELADMLMERGRPPAG